MIKEKRCFICKKIISKNIFGVCPRCARVAKEIGLEGLGWGAGILTFVGVGAKIISSSFQPQQQINDDVQTDMHDFVDMTEDGTNDMNHLDNV